ncbi:tautomerase family protein [Paracoccus aminophilus]|uniref:4-oxalocrotonate tautomerase n=1 Tax=Paracoccus aminophilus JCM 7686 TaxID=1367847 RepID=S5Y5G8_PARAH|nr:tautomerase family protein [Paracoccus aminophilus]AGT10960.1 4-oxalocrotonate tautomerase [Paracoccus aminophilus JCM 7686]
MPHITVKTYPGKTPEQKQRLAEAITRNVMDIFGNSEGAVSVAIEDVSPDRWKAEVYEAEIMHPDTHLFKRPGSED